jgi:hypothetical protein
MQTTEIMLKPELTAQEIFDHAVRTVAVMPQRCEVNGYCAYRSEDMQSACLVGSLMTDEEALADESGVIAGDIWTVKSKGQVPARLIPHMELLASLQAVHDDADNWTDKDSDTGRRKGPADPKDMRRHFGYVAEILRSDLKLDTRVLDEVFPEPAIETVAA